MVRATFSGFSTALSALQANQKRLDITGQNLANMNTVGYTRQQLETSSLNYSGLISHYMSGSDKTVGFGVSMDRISQLRDPYLDSQYRAQINKSSYSEAKQESLDALANVLDESEISGIRQAFDDIQSSLTSMQDPSKVNDPIYETELQAKMEALTNLLNDAARQISSAEQTEFEKLDGTGTSEQGAVQKVNDLLKQIGTLNETIKRNQIMGQPALELTDERNVLLDELAGYIPIDVSYYKESSHSADNDWPNDMRVDMIYTKPDGTSGRLTLIDGTNGKSGENYGRVSVTAGSRDNPTAVKLTFEEAASVTSGSTASIDVSAADSQLSSGSIQAGLDMLGKDGGTGTNGTVVRGYEFYMKKLDTLASEFASIMNGVNAANGGGADDNFLINKDSNPAGTSGITAANIGVNPNWISGSFHISTGGEDVNSTVLDMLEQMSVSHTSLGGKSFADFTNNVSTILANESKSNTTLLETNVTVLNSIQDSRDEISGVSLDEEAANMITYMSAYNAASRLMTALDEALNTLINGTGLVGR